MPSFRYRALTANGELTSGTISAASAAEVARRLESRGLFYVDDGATGERRAGSRPGLGFLNRPTGEDVTVFTRDLALLLKAGARINDALDLLSDDIDLGRLRPVVTAMRDGVLAGESFTEAISRHPLLFPPVYVALVRVGEASGTLDHILEILAEERSRSEVAGCASCQPGVSEVRTVWRRRGSVAACVEACPWARPEGRSVRCWPKGRGGRRVRMPSSAAIS